MNTSGIKHISFDLWLTLIKSNPAFKPLRDKLFGRHFNIAKDDATITAAFRHYDLLFNAINEKAGFNVRNSEMLYVMLDHLGVPIHQVSQSQMDAYYEEMEKLFFEYHPVLLDAQTPNILAAIRERDITISILSNTGFILGETLKKLIIYLEIEPYFCFQLYSDEMGHSKPSPKVFESVLEATEKIKSIEKTEVLHIGDNPIADVEGARTFGFKALLLNEENTLSKLFPL